jgi:hypothetical protein
VLIVKIYGGLAGQMMQYAFACFLEMKKKQEVKLDISFFGEQTHNRSFRKFELLNWNTRFSIAGKQDYEQVFAEVSFTDKVKYKLFKKPVENNPNFYEQKPFCYDEDVLGEDYRIYDGYWVNNQYISAVASRLREEYTPRYAIAPKNQELIDGMQKTNSVSLHFRRGDYVGSAHDVMKKDYYAEAIAYIRAHVKDPVFYVFSDDIDYVKNHYDLSVDTVFIDHNKGEESFWDIYLMSHCSHNVIANSGFSFWGAWLNQHEDARIVAPSEWMSTENKIAENLLLPTWHII